MLSLLAVFAVGAAAQSSGQICFPSEYAMDRQAWHDRLAEYDRTQIWFSHTLQLYRFRDRIITNGQHFLDLIIDAKTETAYEIEDINNSIQCRKRLLDKTFELPYPCISNVSNWEEETVGANLLTHRRYGQRPSRAEPGTDINFSVHYTHATHVPIFVSEWIAFKNGTRHHMAEYYTNFEGRVDPSVFVPPSFCPAVTEVDTRFSGMYGRISSMPFEMQ